MHKEKKAASYEDAMSWHDLRRTTNKGASFTGSRKYLIHQPRRRRIMRWGLNVELVINVKFPFERGTK